VSSRSFIKDKAKLRERIMIDKNNLIAITNAEIVKNLPSNIVFSEWELNLISEKVIKKIIQEVNQNTFDTFVKGN
tara:strand:+ start:608 stop:832 length:225 start_codon:yes stop_codon:yes gene_type:complete